MTHDVKNYLPGKHLYVYGDKAVLKMDATTAPDDSPRINLELFSGARTQGQAGTRINHAANAINIQLDEFEMAELSCVLLGHKTHFSAQRGNSKNIAMTRQADNHDGARIFVKGITTGTSIALPITGGRIFFASMLCVSQLSKMHPGMPIGAILSALSGIAFSQPLSSNNSQP